MVSDSTILGLQFSAAMLMGADYWFENDLLNRMSKGILKVVQPIDDEAGRVISANVRLAREQKISLLLAVVFLLSAWGGTKAIAYLASQQAPAWAIAGSSFVFLCLVAAGGTKFANLAFPLSLILASRIAIRLVCNFLIKCHKGAIFGLGFLLLITSFACQFANLQT